MKGLVLLLVVGVLQFDVIVGTFDQLLSGLNLPNIPQPALPQDLSQLDLSQLDLPEIPDIPIPQIPGLPSLRSLVKRGAEDIKEKMTSKGAEAMGKASEAKEKGEEMKEKADAAKNMMKDKMPGK